ncbi:MAG: hypothetical protein AAGD34_13750 [Pseudomonadota bacterium]
MLTILRDRQCALALAILFSIVSLHATIWHRVPQVSLADVSVAVASAGINAPSFCISGDAGTQPATGGKCDACRLVDAPGLDSVSEAALAHPNCSGMVAFVATAATVRAKVRAGVAMPRAPPMAAAS